MPSIEMLPLFPLSDVVLLPEVSVPLYIFEPRYRQMTRDVLASDHKIGMVTVRPDAVATMAGDPRVFEIGCLGRIVESQERPDGTYQILVAGERRFRILEEHPKKEERLYRTARVETLEDLLADSESDTTRLDGQRNTVLTLLTDMLESARPGRPIAQMLEGFDELEPARLINVLTQSIAFEPIERQQLLEADSILTRFERMEELLRFRLAANGSPTSESGSHLN